MVTPEVGTAACTDEQLIKAKHRYAEQSPLFARKEEVRREIDERIVALCESKGINPAAYRLSAPEVIEPAPDGDDDNDDYQPIRGDL
jgi:hypothetical protein